MSENALRYAAVPLVTVDPFLNIWSVTDELYGGMTVHWTERYNSMAGFISVDGQWYRFMGSIKRDRYTCYKDLRVIPQTDCTVNATETVYTFENSLINLKVCFRTPLLPDDLELMSRPVSYISYDMAYKDGQEHDTNVYFEIGAEACVQDINEEIYFGKSDYSVYCGKGDKDVLKYADDGVLIDWGYLHLIAPGADCRIYDAFDRKEIFLNNKEREGFSGRKKVCDGFPVLSALKSFDKARSVSGFICIGYEDFYSIEYFGEKLESYCMKNVDSFSGIALKAVEEYDAINARCDAFDAKMRRDGEKKNAKYADIISLSYRQIIAAHKLVHKDGKPLLFSKECGSNGCICTVDVTYPSIPVFLIYNPEMIKAMLDPIFDYAENDRGWKYEFAPHDLGVYPKANGQAYGFEKPDPEYILSRQMPVEESGDMILCTAALCKAIGDFEYAVEHFSILKKWADYLIKIGWDPENQLCTDDFAGHLAHNCNLSVKAILAIAAFGYMCEGLGKDGNEYFAKAGAYAKEWEKAAFDGGCYRLAFDKPGTWSLKYNLMWDRYFGFGIFDKKIALTELEFYKTKLNMYGIPLDSRKAYTKSDWLMWTAAMADDKDFFEDTVNSMWQFINDTEDRVPFTDWYETEAAEAAWHFRNRTVQGGLFAPLMFTPTL